MNIRAKGKNWVKRSLVSSRALGFASRLNRPGVAILMYHSVMVEPRLHATTLGEIVHSAGMFRRQMEVIARHYNPVSLDEVLAFVQGQTQMPPKPVVVTFDDGYADNFEVAAPILNEFGIPAVFYATVACVDQATPLGSTVKVGRWEMRPKATRPSRLPANTVHVSRETLRRDSWIPSSVNSNPSRCLAEPDS